MHSNASNRKFIITIVTLWMSVTFIVLKNGSRCDKGTGLHVSNLEITIKLVEAMQQQNRELTDMLSGIRKIGIKDLSSISKQIRSDLEKCLQERNHLISKLEALHTEIGIRSNKKSLQSSESFQNKSTDVLARSVKKGIEELWYYANAKFSEIKQVGNLSEVMIGKLSGIQENLRKRKSSVLVEIETLRNTTNEARGAMMEKLERIVQNRLYYSQNPPNCTDARRLVCNVNKGCGFGCEFHHLIYCFMVALGTNRTLVIKSKHWRYSADGWESVFKPVSNTCNLTNEIPVGWQDEEKSRQIKVVILHSIDGGMKDRPKYLPPAVPGDLAPELIKYHGNPSAWWIGQLAKYLFRPLPWIQEDIKELERKIEFQHPIVGIHVRRTDKIGFEASYHTVEEYMEHVEDWYEKEIMRRKRNSESVIITRRVYVATDDANVFSEARSNFPEYKFIRIPDNAAGSARNTRYTKSSLIGILTDLMMLSKCDFLVGTFSSQVSRLAYELMQPLHQDASSFARSLDDSYYFGGQHDHIQKAIYDNFPESTESEEMRFSSGDLIKVLGNHRNGYSRGVHLKTGKKGLYPSYKVEEVISTVKFPTYPDAQNLR